MPAEGAAALQATQTDSDSNSKPPNAEAGSQIPQQMQEYVTHSNGSTSAKVEGKQAESSSIPDTNDTELQRRKAALLQQVRGFSEPRPSQYVCKVGLACLLFKTSEPGACGHSQHCCLL